MSVVESSAEIRRYSACIYLFKFNNGNTRLILLAPTPQNGQIYSNNLLSDADELFECVWSFCGIGA